MRETKFKVWNGKQMSPPFTIWDITQDESFRYYLGSFKAYGIEKIIQYTGRKDKNGKKLYEGDEVAAHHPDHTEIFIGDVVFDVELLTYYFDGPRFYIPISEFEDFEIIGNIYEENE